jgi:hypothetical protein
MKFEQNFYKYALDSLVVQELNRLTYSHNMNNDTFLSHIEER